MRSFKIRCANLVIEIFCKFENTVEHCRKYIVEDSPSVDIKIIPQEKDYELIRSYLKDDSDENIELTVISYMLSDALISHNAAVIHGGAISFDEKGVVFTASSGTGKTTHMKLWGKVFGRSVSPVNGDKPIISVNGNEVFVSGSPFCGKEGYSENITVPLKAICFIERGIDNSIEKLSQGEVLSRIFKQLFIPKVGSELMSKALELVDIIVKNTEFYLLKCNMTDEAPKVAHSGIFGEMEDRL